jgi:hypothetical protein
MPRLAQGAETSITMAWQLMGAAKIRRLLRLFLVFFELGLAHGSGLPPHGWR